MKFVRRYLDEKEPTLKNFAKGGDAAASVATLAGSARTRETRAPPTRGPSRVIEREAEVRGLDCCLRGSSGGPRSR